MNVEHEEILAVDAAWSRAMVGNDADAIGGFMADEWVMVSDSGVGSKEHFLSLVRTGQLTHSAFERVTAPRVRVYGPTALVTARVTNTAHHRGRRYDSDEWTTDVFVRRKGLWLCVLSHVTAASTSQDAAELSGRAGG